MNSITRGGKAKNRTPCCVSAVLLLLLLLLLMSICETAER
jgi:hypothetical protein